MLGQQTLHDSINGAKLLTELDNTKSLLADTSQRQAWSLTLTYNWSINLSGGKGWLTVFFAKEDLVLTPN